MQYSEVDIYMDQFSGPVRRRLDELRAFILKTLPDVEEQIAYKMPAYALKGERLVYFAGYKAHIGFYPTGMAMAAFIDRMGVYKHSKGAVQFSPDKSLPKALIKDILLYRYQAVMQKKEKAKKVSPKGESRQCEQGHAYYKSSDCPVCPICEKAKQQQSPTWMKALSAPARRALAAKGIRTEKQLAAYREKEVLSWHGIGPKALPVLNSALSAKALQWKKEKI